MDEKKIQELSDEEKLRFLHELGEELWQGSKFNKEVYQEWKALYLPKHLPEAFLAQTKNWKTTLTSWLDECLITVCSEIFSKLYDDKILVLALIDDIKTNHRAEALKLDLLKNISREYFNRKDHTDQLFPLTDFIKDYLAKLYCHDELTDAFFWYVKDKIDLPDPLPATINVSNEHFKHAHNNLLEVVYIELESNLRATITQNKILNVKGTIFNGLAENLKYDRFLNDFFQSIEADLANSLFKHKGQAWQNAINENLKNRLLNLKLNRIKSNFDTFIKDIQKKPLTQLDLTDKLFSNLLSIYYPKQDNKFDLLRLPPESKRNLLSELKNILICLFYDWNVSNGYFLFDHPGLKNRDEIIAKAPSLLMNALFKMRNTKLHLVMVPATEIQANKFAYKTVFPANYKFNKITNSAELFAAFKLTERSLRRIYKFLALEVFLKPTIKNQKLKNQSDRSSLIPSSETSIWGNTYCFHYPLKGFGKTSVTYELTTYGVIDPLVQAFTSYKTAAARLKSFQQHLDKEFSDQQIARLVIATLNGNLQLIAESSLPVPIKITFLQFLCDFSICLFMIEGIRNRASFASHPLVLENIENGSLTFEQALTDQFPMTPQGSAASGRELHVSLVKNSGLFSGSASKNSDAELRKREKNCLTTCKNLTRNQVKAKLCNFWQPVEKRKSEAQHHLKSEDSSCLQPLNYQVGNVINDIQSASTATQSVDSSRTKLIG
ncbi:MAG: hypothetical protein K0S11_1129 [Gammaproteobacteria bacterium]|jgi:hypothetical protein|nr:hypothetical protein [Gammaproteobacteria bacterium]